MSEVERSELRAVDAALSGGVVAAEHEELAELAHELRAGRARPSAAFSSALDRRAAQGFRRPRRRRTLVRRLLPAGAGLAIAGIAAALVVVSGLGGAPSHGPAARSGATGGSSFSAGPVKATSGAGSAGAGVEKGPAQAAGAAPAEPPAPREVERGSTLDVGVPSGAMQSTAQRVFSIAAAYGGYVTQSNVSTGSAGESYASFQLRLPSGRLAGALAALSHLGHVRSETDTTNDVTSEHDSLARSLGDLRAERASLLREIAAATDAATLAELRARLRAVEGRMGAVEGSLHALQRRVDFSPLALSLTAEGAAGGAASGSSLTPGSALGVAGEILTTALAVLVIALAAALPLGAAGLAGGAAFGRSRRQARERALDAG